MGKTKKIFPVFLTKNRAFSLVVTYTTGQFNIQNSSYKTIFQKMLQQFQGTCLAKSKLRYWCLVFFMYISYSFCINLILLQFYLNSLTYFINFIIKNISLCTFQHLSFIWEVGWPELHQKQFQCYPVSGQNQGEHTPHQLSQIHR